MYDIYCKLRDMKGVKDADVAKATGITKSTFSDWKSGRSNPKQDKLQKIANYFGVSIDYLTNGKKEWKPELTSKDEKDIKKAIEDFKNKLSTAGVMYDGYNGNKEKYYRQAERQRIRIF